MLSHFVEFVQDHQLFQKNHKVLVGVSGGIDSVVLCHLLSQWGVNFGIAHCNFGLRGAESDGDEIFVTTLADQYGANYHATRFDTKAAAEKQGISIQMAARELRMRWFEKIRSKNDYQCILLGTHLNDSIETVIINLTRGTGISGLTGIAPKNGFLVRPLLNFTRDQIEEFAKQEKLNWREDSSNADTKYTRNKIRHEIIPVLAQINPSYTQTFKDNMERFSQAENVLTKALIEKRNELTELRGGWMYVDIEKLLNEEEKNFLLYRILEPYGFNSTQVRDIFKAIESQPGKQFKSEAYTLTVDRGQLLVTPIEPEEYPVFFLEREDSEIQIPFHLKLEQVDVEEVIISGLPNEVYVDLQKLIYPLELRVWKEGDQFQPLGMRGKKKVSDFLIDRKVSRPEKAQTYVLVSGNRIIWVVGQQIDERYKISQKTKSALKLTVNQQINAE